MQEDFNKDFDLMVRESLQDAGIKPSRGVWKAVSVRVNAAPAASAASRAHASGWMWAFAGVAAAALAAVLVVPGVFRAPETPALELVSEAAAGPESPETILTENYIDILTADNVSDRAVRTSASTAPVLRAEEAVAQGTAIEETAAQEPVMEEPVAAEEPAAEPAVAVRPSKQPVTDPFEGIEWEDSPLSEKPGVALTVAGSLLGNDSDASVVKSAEYCLPGEGSGFVAGLTENSESAYGLPLSFGAGVRFYLNNKLSIGTGINYSMLTRTFTGTYTEQPGVPAKITNGQVLHTMQYVGVPLGVYYDIIRTGDFLFYVYGNGQAEYCVSNKYDILGSNGEVRYSEPVKGLQYSAGVGLGVEFKLADKLGLYLDPGARYYFDCNQPRSMRTARPFMISFEAGLRFDL